MICEFLRKKNVDSVRGWGIAGLACVAITIAGCGETNVESSLPPEQAEAVAALRKLRASVHIRKGVVTFVDFYATRDTAAAVGYLKKFKRLKMLNFGSTRVTDDELKNIAHLSELEELALNNTRVTDEAMQYLERLTSLVSLNMEENDISDAGLVYLKDLKNLERLYLNETKITNAGMHHFGGLEKLKWVLLIGTEVTKEGVAELHKSLPNTEVVLSLTKDDPPEENNDVESTVDPATPLSED
jgi:hypothetical protein